MHITDIDSAIIAALGGRREASGIEPATIIHRMNAMAGDTKAVVHTYLERTMQFTLPEADWPEGIHEIVVHWLASEMPELSDVTRQKLACYYTYQWR